MLSQTTQTVLRPFVTATCCATDTVSSSLYIWTQRDWMTVLKLSPNQKIERDLRGHPPITWMKTVLNDPESHNLTLTEAVNVTQNRPLWRLLSASGATYS